MIHLFTKGSFLDEHGKMRSIKPTRVLHGHLGSAIFVARLQKVKFLQLLAGIQASILDYQNGGCKGDC